MRTLRNFAAFALLLAFGGCSDGGRESPSRPIVKVSPNLPASLRDAVLLLSVRDPAHGSTFGDRSLESPVGSGSGSDGHFDEERLIAIRADGFEVLLTQGQDHIAQTAGVFFPFGKTTELSVLGCKVAGKFKNPGTRGGDPVSD
jgi:hypothetical protein